MEIVLLLKKKIKKVNSNKVWKLKTIKQFTVEKYSVEKEHERSAWMNE